MDKIISNMKKKLTHYNGRSQSLLSHNFLNVPKITMTLDDDGAGAEVDVKIDTSSQMTTISLPPTNNNVCQQQSYNKLNKIASTYSTTNKNYKSMIVNDAMRKVSTGTLNRLVLVAQTLESEVDSQRNSSWIVCVIRMANMVFLFLVNVLILTGIGQYQGQNEIHFSLLLTMDKWYFRHCINLPSTFAEMRLSGQYLAQMLSAFMLFATFIFQILHCCRVQHLKLICICYSFGCVPFSLLVFGLEMHYSACPWLDDCYRASFHPVKKYFDTQCGINGWALAGIFSLLSCGLFVSEGLITAFFRFGYSHNKTEKKEIIL